jgi:membrane dipeptidase
VTEKSAPAPAQRAKELARRFIIVDGHIDVPWRLEESRSPTGAITQDIAQHTEKGDFDYPRAVAGGLDAPFMSIYVPAKYQSKGGAAAMADRLIDIVEGFARAAPDKFALAPTVDKVVANSAAGLISLPMGMENGAPLEGKLENIPYFFLRGIRYITLTHSKDNDICDSSYDTAHTWKGLSPFGRKVVAEMNRVGIMIDVSHISDDAFAQVIELSAVPVIASHSSCRRFTPGWERNMSDEMIKKLAARGGVIMINFGSGFINEQAHAAGEARWEAAKQFARAKGIEEDDPAVEKFYQAYDGTHPRVYATVEQVADHIDHVAKLVGIDHVGFGSDFDGVGDSLPTGLKNVAQYPNLIQVLLERGYSEADIEKICSGNVLRVWRAVEAYAATQH